MIIEKNDNRRTPIEDRKQHMAHAKKMLLAGMPQRQVASLLGYTPKTINEWTVKFKWRDKLTELRKNKHTPAKKLNDSLSTFMMYLKKKDPVQYNTLQPIYKDYIRK